MSGPGGSTTKRDQRRESRRQQLQERQRIRERERQRKIRNQRLRLAAFIGVPVLLIALLVVVLVMTHQGPSASTTGLQPASGQTVDGMECTGSEQLVYHIHAYLAIYVDGNPITVPPGIGIVAPAGSGESALASNGLKSCIYPLHVHDGEVNIVHIESPIQKTYTTGNFFDLWGQSLSATEFMGKKVDSAHKLTFQVFDASGKLKQTTTDPRAIGISEHETIAILYNSPNVQAKPFTGWSQYNV
jgi:hypothetical protein